MPLKRNIAYEDEGNDLEAPATKHIRTGDRASSGGKGADEAGEGCSDGGDATRNTQGQQGEQERNDIPNDEDDMPVDM